jgi:hypothetical protein
MVTTITIEQNIQYIFILYFLFSIILNQFKSNATSIPLFIGIQRMNLEPTLYFLATQ